MPERSTTKLHGQRAIIVDDDAASAKLVSVLLQAEGCETRTAGTAEAALTLLAEFHPRLIVLDLVLPMMSGFLLAQRLKADAHTRDITLIAVTGFNGGAITRAAIEAGFVACVRKPIEPEAFIQLVCAHLGVDE